MSLLPIPLGVGPKHSCVPACSVCLAIGLFLGCLVMSFLK